jgi:hypothetical protein
MKEKEKKERAKEGKSVKATFYKLRHLGCGV